MNQQDVILGRAVLAWGLVDQASLMDCAEEARRWGEMGRPTNLGEVLLARGLLSVDRYQTIVAHLHQAYSQPNVPQQVQQATAQIPSITRTGRYTKAIQIPQGLGAEDSSVERVVQGWGQAASQVTADGSQIDAGGRGPIPQRPDPAKIPDTFLRKRLGVPPDQEQFTLGPWLTVKYLAAGNWGIVYQVTRLNGDGKSYALKLLKQMEGSEQVRKRFIQEARTMAKLRHPGICHVYDAGVVQGLPFFVMDYLEGPDLKAVFEEGPLGVPRALQVLTKICDAVAYAHSEGILHRDLKPENVIMVGKSEPVLTDFGLAKDTQSS